MSLIGRSIDWLMGGPKIGGVAEARLGAWRGRRPPDLGHPHARTRYVVVDVETTGLDLRRDTLVAVGAVGVARSRIAIGDAYSAVLRQAQASPHANILIHGIGGEAQLAGTDPVWALIEFLEWAGKSPLVAFRAEFDQTMLERGMKDLFGVPVGFAWIDLAFLLPALFRGTECDSLDDWTGHFGIAAGTRHDAVADAFATAQLFLIALQAADAVGMGSAGQLLEMQKAQRWLGTRR
jgi:DNA polymerase-3 subunit epsilon